MVGDVGGLDLAGRDRNRESGSVRVGVTLYLDYVTFFT